MITTAIVPAAGQGTRLKPFTNYCPKELFPVARKPVINHTLESLVMSGVKNAFIVVGTNKGPLIENIGSGEEFGLRVAYIYQQRPLGLGHAILLAKDFISEHFMVALGDSYIDPRDDVKKLKELHESERAFASLLVWPVSDPSNYGVVSFETEPASSTNNFSVADLFEKPATSAQRKPFCYSDRYYAITGVYALSPKIFHYLEKTHLDAKGELQITNAIRLALQDGEKIIARSFEGTYIDIGNWESAEKAQRHVLNKSTSN